MAEARRIKGFKQTLKTHGASLNALATFSIDYNRDTQSGEVEVRFKHLEALWSKVEAIQEQLDASDEEGYNENLTVYAEMEQLYYQAYSFLSSEVKQQVKQLPVTSSSTPAVPQMRLPKLSLPVFDGKYENWLNFHDSFMSMVHNAPGLSNIQRFHYLRVSLTNTALQLVQGISISEENYSIAWELLLKHYNDPNRLKAKHVEQLFEYTALKRESAAELRTLVEKFGINVKVLKQLGEPTEHWDTLLVFMLSRSLDPKTRRDWEEHISSDVKISFAELTNFILRRALVLDKIPAKAEIPTPKKGIQRPLASNTVTKSYRKCASCEGDHLIYSCVQFSQLPLADKETIVRNGQLCRNCLRPGHVSNNCKSSSNCRSAGGNNQHRPTFANRNTNPPPSSSNAPGVESISCHYRPPYRSH
ncbi:uncharacterized protein LOC125765746 [Anopheles funestus]|uniref:uncharacterized protein LOC125765746 n=1 Tax=Anopheles funestus TaxID=62324 RepID=UPI0020C682FD|nr:uncharacterized protein LOC125765746 [Anopheles funestus]